MEIMIVSEDYWTYITKKDIISFYIVINNLLIMIH